MKNLSKVTYSLFFLLLFVSLLLFQKSASAQSPIQCGLLNEPCCNFTNSNVQCKTGLKCDNNRCVDDGSGRGLSQSRNTSGSTDPNPIPKPRIPCDPRATEDPEFHSLRPYQASPCGNEGKMAYFCGNKIVIKEDFDESEIIPAGDSCKSEWEYNPPKKNVDPGTINDPKDYYIDISETEFPFAGNTEQVSNSQTKADVFDDATKVNEYASWYLNGVINRAEYGDTKNTNYELVNLSGPIQKLMPSIILDAQRIGTINLINNQSDPQTEEEDKQDQEGTALNHNQIVVCSDSNVPFVGNLLNIGTFKPVPCYKGGGSSAGGFLGLSNEVERLRDWEGDLSLWNSYVSKVLGTVVKLLPSIPEEIINESLLKHWNSRKPPLPWENDPFSGQPMTELQYRKYYNEWKGKTCVIVPLLNWLICFENLLVPNKYADLFPYVPLSTTADKNKKMLIDPVTIQPTSGMNISAEYWDDFEGKGEPVFYFPHTGEIATLSAFLNKTYIPKDIPQGEIMDLKTVEKNVLGQCRTATVRSNEGDNLFPIKKPGDVGVQVYFEVNSIPFVGESAPYTNNQGESVKKCKYSGTVTIEIHTNPVKVPFGEETWQTTVAGPTSTVRRIFPKVEKGAPIECIADIPSETKAVYTPVVGTDKIEVFSLQNPAQKFDPNDARIYFPHWGSIYDYFLKGIQTAIRPKGYGEKIVSGTLCENQDNLDPGNCSFDMNKINAAISSAAAKYNVPESLLRAIFEIESYEYIADPSSYVCEENFAGAAGVAQIIKETYDDVTCSNEKMDNDIPMCGEYDPKLSRCNIEDAFELMARILLYKAGRWNTSSCTGGSILESEKMVWYDASCNYYGSHSPDGLTQGLAEDFPASEMRNGDPNQMNYCDIVCYKMGQCPPYPN